MSSVAGKLQIAPIRERWVGALRTCRSAGFLGTASSGRSGRRNDAWFPIIAHLATSERRQKYQSMMIRRVAFESTAFRNSTAARVARRLVAK